MQSPRGCGATPEAVGVLAGRLRAFSALALSALALVACAPQGPAEHRVTGRALGTTWSVIVVDDDRSTTSAAVEALVTAALAEIDVSASTYRDDSELARFARLGPGERMPMSEHLRLVLDEARFAHERSGGAFDPTVAPLVALYGFGAGAADAPPTEEQRAAAHDKVDFDAVQWAQDAAGAWALGRAREDVRLDLSAVAKGYAVDVIAARLRALGEGRFLAEVGGELVLAGTRVSGQPWVVAIDAPTEAPPLGPPGSPGRPLHALLAVSDRGLATSGDYRQYHKDNEGRRYTHAIDPRTGRAVSNEVASVTVIAPTCMRADAFATTVMVLGAERGLALLEELPDVEGMILLHPLEGAAAGAAPVERATSGFASYRLESRP